MTKNVVVVGGSYAGLQIAHKLLKHTLPSENDLKVILVAKSDHLYWNLASVRAIVPGVLKDEQVFQPIEPGFAKYPSGSFEFVLGAASKLDADAKSLSVTTASGERSIPYDFIVLTTGARTASSEVPWKSTGTYEEDLEALHSIAKKVESASHIVIAGSGPTGVETAGELGYEYGKDREIILVSADNQLLGGDSIAAAAEKELFKLGVKIRKSVKATGSTATPDGKTEVTLSNGEKIITDLYLPTTGLIPNSEYIDAKLLNEHKYVAVDEFFRARGYENIWACGDLVSSPRASFPITDKQAGGVYKNVEAALKGKPQQVVKGMPIDVLLCSTGRGRATGRLGVVKLPSLAAWGMKGRTLAIEMLPKYASGSQW
ncbi:hypothetical protein BN1708_003062 [Verticillium longisporum]|uniref:FAD/NAD(P)-binding domain-containing protein n=1 Tax=Verticillium longisporum TaxID=100787 RepID=A0A0G4L741_VERLO|nr:Oxidoreductase ptaL like protein [Verticillium longisporum]CRK17784.1 hypothetical protein BN1708_003062 [Verticillium longisporum]